MKFTYTLPLLVLCSSLYLTFTNAANLNIVNQCNYTVWVAASSGGGKRLDQGQSWSLDVAPGTTGARIWGRTNCNFDANGQGQCQIGDFNGHLECQGYARPPNTLVEFTLNQNKSDYTDISNIDGFKVPLKFSFVAPCRVIRCSVLVVEQCPAELRTLSGYNNPSTVFKTNEYCCADGPGSCGPTNYSRFFKNRCPDAYSYPQDDSTSLFTCPSGTNYRVVFYP